MIVYLIKKSTMGGSEFLKEAYIDLQAASLFCENKKEEWTSYHPEKTSGEEISNGRVIVNGNVYRLNGKSGKEALRKQALKKLTPDEREALGFPRRI